MRVIDTGNLHRYVHIVFFSNYWFIYYFRVSSWKMIYLFCSQSLTESYFLWDFVLANEVCHFWSASQQNLVCTGNLKGEWNYWIKVDKIKRSITIQDQSQKFWMICVLSTQSRSNFNFLFFFSFLATQTKVLALKESASQREQSVPLPQQQCHQYSVCLGTKGKYHTSCSCMYAFQPHPLLFIWCISILLTFPFSSSQFSS